MTETRQRAADHYPEIGGRVSLALMRSAAERVATVTEVSIEETLLELTRPALPLPFKQGEPVWMKHCEEEDIFYWGGVVNEVSGPQNQRVAITDSGDWVRLERRQYSRLAVDIPITFRVVNAPSSKIPTEVVYSNKTQNMSVGGLAFETQVPLEKGDELQINFDVAWPQELTASGWIVRSEPIQQGGKCLNRVAFEFLGLPTRERKLILAFLDATQVRPA